jgi:HPt (histidine-containing phosphotransfer) domain-containing protein
MEAHFDAVESIKSIESNYGPQVAREVVQIFISDYSAKIQKLRKAIEAGNLESVRFAAHDIKSGCLSMGVKPMSDICDKIEREAATLAKEEMLAMTDTLEKDYLQISKEYGGYFNLTH